MICAVFLIIALMIATTLFAENTKIGSRIADKTIDKIVKGE